MIRVITVSKSAVKLLGIDWRQLVIRSVNTSLLVLTRLTLKIAEQRTIQQYGD